MLLLQESNFRRVTGRGFTAARPATYPHSYGTTGLLLRFASFGAASHFALGHVAGETTDVVLQNLVLVFQLVVVRLDRVNAFGEGLEGRLEGFGLPISLSQ